MPQSNNSPTYLDVAKIAIVFGSVEISIMAITLTLQKAPNMFKLLFDWYPQNDDERHQQRLSNVLDQNQDTFHVLSLQSVSGFQTFVAFLWLIYWCPPAKVSVNLKSQARQQRNNFHIRKLRNYILISAYFFPSFRFQRSMVTYRRRVESTGI